jgi:hypothetical protein
MAMSPLMTVLDMYFGEQLQLRLNFLLTSLKRFQTYMLLMDITELLLLIMLVN